MSLAAGAFDDVVFEYMLAVMLATFGAGPRVAVLAIGVGQLYATFIILFGRNLLEEQIVRL